MGLTAAPLLFRPDRRMLGPENDERRRGGMLYDLEDMLYEREDGAVSER